MSVLTEVSERAVPYGTAQAEAARILITLQAAESFDALEPVDVAGSVFGHVRGGVSSRQQSPHSFVGALVTKVEGENSN